MEKIFTVTVLQNRPSANYKRCVGWFKDLDAASSNVKLNCGDIHNGSGCWVVIEEIGPGFYASSITHETWFAWNENFKQYEKCPKPAKFNSIRSFGLGQNPSGSPIGQS